MREALERARRRHEARRAEQAEQVRAARAQRAKLLARSLADRDVPCPECGYNLRGAVGDVCPECGADILRLLAWRPRLVLPRPVQTPPRPLSRWGLFAAGGNFALMLVSWWRLWDAFTAWGVVADDWDLKSSLMAGAVSFCGLLVWLGGPWRDSPWVRSRAAIVLGMGLASALCLYRGWG